MWSSNLHFIGRWSRAFQRPRGKSFASSTGRRQSRRRIADSRRVVGHGGRDSFRGAARAGLEGNHLRRIRCGPLDLSLPDAHGLEAISRVQGHAPGVPIVVLTGLNNEEVAVKALEQGAQDYLIKGQVDGALLTRALRYAIQRQRAEEALFARNRELLILRKISETILGSLDLKDVLGEILEQAMLCCSLDLGNIRLLDLSGENLEVAVARGYRDPQNVFGHRRISRATQVSKSRFGERIFSQPCVQENVQTTKCLLSLKKDCVKSIHVVTVVS